MKDIKGYEGLYAITSCGKVWSYRGQKFLKPAYDGNKYLTVVLCKDGQRKQYKIHRLVAVTYIPNPDNKPQVNHIDENKEHNYINNLEWATAKENCNHGTKNQRMRKNYKRQPIYCVELSKVFNGVVEAAKYCGTHKQNVSACCRGRQKTAGGYHFCYWNDEETLVKYLAADVENHKAATAYYLSGEWKNNV